MGTLTVISNQITFFHVEPWTQINGLRNEEKSILTNLVICVFSSDTVLDKICAKPSLC